jgi:hypothetical protein
MDIGLEALTLMGMGVDNTFTPCVHREFDVTWQTTMSLLFGA